MAHPLGEEAAARIAAHRDRYLASGGAEGAVSPEGQPVLLLTTVGRRSGRDRTTPILYTRDGERHLVAASLAGHDEHPQWYRNLVAEPRVTAQVGAERFAALARTATPDERPRLWQLLVAGYPTFEDYQRKTAREIPVVVLERVDGGA